MTTKCIVFLVAGMSSRFLGKIKQFASVGPRGETLIEYSMNQALSAGANKIVFVVGEKTEQPFKEKFGEEYFSPRGESAKIFYAKQTFDSEKRDKPWGTVDALVSAKPFVNEPFLVCTGDDIYGKESFEQVFGFFNSNPNECITLGFTLNKVIDESNSNNRGVYVIGKDDYIDGLTEVLGVGLNNLSEKNLSGKELCSTNFFGLQKNVLDLLEQKLIQFKEQHNGDRKKECLLPEELGNLIKENKIKIKLLKATGNWFGVTKPEDEEKVRQALSNSNN